MNTRFKVFASHDILQYLCDFIHVLIFVIVSKCQKSPKLTNIVMHDATRDGSPPFKDPTFQLIKEKSPRVYMLKIIVEFMPIFSLSYYDNI